MTPKHPMDRLPEKHVIVEETWGRSEPEYKDNLGNKYVKNELGRDHEYYLSWCPTLC